MYTCMQGLGHVSVEARSWHTATIRARYPCAEAAIASLMRWPTVAALPAATSTAATSDWGTPPPPLAVCSSSLRRHTGVVPTAGAVTAPTVGVFINHPEHGSYIPSLPMQVLALSLQPSMAGLGQVQRQQMQTLLVQQARVLEGSRHGLMQMPGGMGGWRACGAASLRGGLEHMHAPWLCLSHGAMCVLRCAWPRGAQATGCCCAPLPPRRAATCLRSCAPACTQNGSCLCWGHQHQP
jgi:hypothetical protein